MPKNICPNIINCHYDNLLANHFRIKKMKELVMRKYLWLIFHQDVEAYVKGNNVYLASKIVCFKSYRDV